MSSLRSGPLSTPLLGGEQVLFVSVWRVHVLEFAKTLDEKQLDRETWIAEGVDASNRNEWVLACFPRCSFAIRCAWESLYGNKTPVPTPAAMIIGNSPAVRARFADLVLLTIMRRVIVDDVLTPHRDKSRKLSDDENFTYLTAVEKQMADTQLWFLDWSRAEMRVVDSQTELNREVAVKVPGYTHVKQFKVSTTHTWRDQLLLDLLEELHRLLVGNTSADVLAQACREIVAPWIGCCDATQTMQALVLVVSYMAAMSRVEKAKDLQSRRKKPPAWLVNRLLGAKHMYNNMLRELALLATKAREPLIGR